MENWEILDEFLEYCVEEHNGDFDAISQEFLEVASGLDNQLAGRAEEAFSALALRQRYLQLHPEEATKAPTEDATEASELTVDQLPEVEAWHEDPPSQFSVLTDSLQDRVRRIYNNVQLRLPSAYADAEDDAEDEAEAAEHHDGASEKHGSDSEENLGGLEDAAVRLFGSSNLGNVVADLSKDSGAPMANGSPQKMEHLNRDPSGLIARALRGEDESSEDSAVDDFRAMRKAVKESSQQVAADPKVRKLRELPKAAVKASPKQMPKMPKVPKVTPGFVRLELVESTSEEEEEEVSESSEEEETQNSNHLRVLSRLESSAPNGECPWDVWLQATRAWPQLKAKLNSPDFSRKNGELCVHFDVSTLQRLIDEEKILKAEAKAALLRSRMEHENPTKVVEYIEEAERRRAMIGGRVGGFLLAPRNEKLEETLRREKPQRENLAPHSTNGTNGTNGSNGNSNGNSKAHSNGSPFSPFEHSFSPFSPAPRETLAKVPNSDDRLNAVKVK